eukprot:GHVN01086346.1.p1 GENE.GHVN01086346.1~~GHVN01086346.1.p1  ORF type:complete len:301 (+),score=76.80 GHVN01086346.1:10-912(+)
MVGAKLFSFLFVLGSAWDVTCGNGKKNVMVCVSGGPTKKTREVLHLISTNKTKGMFYFSSEQVKLMPKDEVKKLVKDIHKERMFVGLYLDRLTKKSADRMSKTEFLVFLKKEAKEVGLYLPIKGAEPKIFTTNFPLSKQQREWAKEASMIPVIDSIKKPYKKGGSSEEAAGEYNKALSSAGNKRIVVFFNEKKERENETLKKLLVSLGDAEHEMPVKNDVPFEKEDEESNASEEEGVLEAKDEGEEAEGEKEDKEEAEEKDDEAEKEEKEDHLSSKEKESGLAATSFVLSGVLSVWLLLG